MPRKLSPRTRKQVDELRAADFDAYPCWEYATHEEGRKGQDECTVRPVVDGLPPAGQALVQAVFFFPGGQVRQGMVTLNAGDDPSGHQPVLFLGKGLLHFYNGSFEPGRAELRRFVRKLEEISPQPFPVRYVSSLLTAEGRPLAFGELSGLYWLVDWRTGELRAES